MYASMYHQTLNEENYICIYIKQTADSAHMWYMKQRCHYPDFQCLLFALTFFKICFGIKSEFEDLQYEYSKPRTKTQLVKTSTRAAGWAVFFLATGEVLLSEVLR